MDRTKRNVAALGILTILAVGVFFWGMYYLLGNSVLSGGSNLVVELTNGGGLKRGDRAMLHGIIIGSVKDIQLVPTGVNATVRLNQKVDLPKDTRAVVGGDVFGAHWVDLQPGTAQALLENNDSVHGEVAPEIMAQASGLAVDAKTILRRTESLLSEEAIANLHATSAQMPATAAQMRAALQELRLASASLRRTAEGVESAKTGAALTAAIVRIDSGAARIRQAVNTLDESFVSMRSVFGKIDRGEGSLGRMVNDTSLYAELHGAAKEIRALAADIKANPKRYIDLHVF